MKVALRASALVPVVAAAWVGAIATLALRAEAAAEGRPPAVMPRFETPSELEEQRSRPRFRRAVIEEGAPPPPAAGVANAAPPGTAPAADGTEARPRPMERGAPRRQLTAEARVFDAPAMFAHAFGGVRTFADQPLLARQRRPGERKVGPDLDDVVHSAAYVRGYYSYLGGYAKDWAGIDVAAYHELKGGVAGALVFRHEQRETEGTQGVVSLVLPVNAAVAVVPTAGVSAGADYMPEGMFAAEVRGGRDRRFGYAFGVEGTSWSATRAHFGTTAAALFRFADSVFVEQRLDVGRWSSSDDGGRPDFRAATTFLVGTDGSFLFEQRSSAGIAPKYRPGAPLSQRPDEATVDLAFSARHWLATTFGYIASVEIGKQWAAYTRLGVDTAFFAAF